MQEDSQLPLNQNNAFFHHLSQNMMNNNKGASIKGVRFYHKQVIKNRTKVIGIV